MVAPHLTQPPVDIPEKAIEDGSQTWAPDTNPGDQDGVSDCWLLSSPKLASLAIWGGGPLTRSLLSLRFCLYMSQIYTSIKQKKKSGVTRAMAAVSRSLL